MGRQFPRIRLRVNGHALDGVKYADGWAVTIPSWPALAEQYRGADDVSACLEEFERRASGAAIEAPRVRVEVLAGLNPPCVVFLPAEGR